MNMFIENYKWKLMKLPTIEIKQSVFLITRRILCKKKNVGTRAVFSALAHRFGCIGRTRYLRDLEYDSRINLSTTCKT